MSITEINKIDIVAVRPASSIVRLVITDHLTWDDLDAHCRMLQDKVNAYLEFVESGQIFQLREPNIPPNPEICIVLAVKYTPTEEARAFLAQVERFLATAGLGFELDLRTHK